jgi:hypothetical protein
MLDPRETWETYARSWKAPAVADKRALFDAALAPDCVYTDPLTRAEGWEALLAYMSQFHQQVPGGHFVTQRFLHHSGRSVVAWTMNGADGTVLGDGISYVTHGDDGRLTSMTGFFETP